MAQRPARAKIKSTQRVAVTTSTPSPVKGLNAHDAISVMNNTYAITLENFICQPYGVQVRQGYKKHATGIVDLSAQSSYVETLMPYIGTSSVNSKLFAASASFIYDVTSLGTTSPTAVQSGFSSAQWSHTNFSTNAGHFLVCANSVGSAALLYNGSSWTSFTQVSTPTLPGQVSGSDPNTWSYVLSHQQRLWFIEKNTTRCGYLPPQSLGGPASILDFGAYFPRGGYLVAIGSWALDSGAGMQEHFVGISSEGDVVIYVGYDPSDFTNWTLAGTYKLGAPVGPNPFLKYSGDLLVITQDGLVPLSKMLQSARVSTSDAVSNAIEHTISEFVSSNSTLPGWQAINYPGKNLLILNVPQINRSANIQFVMSTITHGWSKFTGIPAQCWAVFNNQLYFGGFGMVGIALTGYSDGATFDNSGGTAITGIAQQAFSYFDTPGTKKKFNMVRPVIMGTNTPTVTISCNVDYNLTQLQSAPALLSGFVAGTWDYAQWDTQVWSGQTMTFQNWQTISAMGYAASLNITISAPSEATWVSSDWIIEEGDVI